MKWDSSVVKLLSHFVHCEVKQLKTDELKKLPVELRLAKELVYDPCHFVLTDLTLASESKEYDACTFMLDKRFVIYRAAKVTPTKTGQFVTIWKRKKGGPIEPYNSSDNIDFIIISATTNDRAGQFIFTKSILLEKGILSHRHKEGKRGIRVYPPWDEAINKQAQKTQQWQSAFFLEITSGQTINFNLAKQLIKTK